MENTPSKGRFALIFSFLLLVLFVLPGGSWYYLKKGADYRISHIKDMVSKGDFNNENIVGITKPNIDSLYGKTIIVGLSNQESTHLQKMDSQLEKLMDQFGERKDFKIIRLVESESGAEDFVETSQKHIWVANQTKASIEKCGIASEMNYPIWALVDHENQIRNYYALDDFEKLVVQSAMILPIEKRKKIDLKRDKEI